MPIKVGAEINVKTQEKIEYKEGWEITSQENTLHKPDNEIVEKLRQEYEVAQTKLRIKATHYASYSCYCAWYLEVKYGIPKTPLGYAGSYKPGSTTPSAQGFVLTYESSKGHIAHYTLQGNILLLDDEANYVTCRVTHTRTLPVSSPLIRGYL